MPTFNLNAQAANFSAIQLMGKGQGGNLSKVKRKSAIVQLFSILCKTEVMVLYLKKTLSLKFV